VDIIGIVDPAAYTSAHQVAGNLLDERYDGVIIDERQLRTCQRRGAAAFAARPEHTGDLLTRERPQLPIFARGLVASANGAERPGWINVPVICGGVIVHPGDIVLGDCDGLVVLPRDDAQRILQSSESYTSEARAQHAVAEPYWARRRSEQKLRALPGVEFDT
jgi:hypothetical protein